MFLVDFVELDGTCLCPTGRANSPMILFLEHLPLHAPASSCFPPAVVHTARRVEETSSAVLSPQNDFPYPVCGFHTVQQRLETSCWSL